jgi:hypothetical protein
VLSCATVPKRNVPEQATWPLGGIENAPFLPVPFVWFFEHPLTPPPAHPRPSFNRIIEWMKSCRPRTSVVAPQGFVTEAYATSAKEKAIACSSTAPRHWSGQSNLSANGEARGHLSGNGNYGWCSQTPVDHTPANSIGRSNTLHKTYAPVDIEAVRNTGSLERTAADPCREQTGGFCINSEAERCINSEAARL